MSLIVRSVETASSIFCSSLICSWWFGFSEGVNHALHLLITIFFPPWIIVWFLLVSIGILLILLLLLFSSFSFSPRCSWVIVWIIFVSTLILLIPLRLLLLLIITLFFWPWFIVWIILVSTVILLIFILLFLIIVVVIVIISLFRQNCKSGGLSSFR